MTEFTHYDCFVIVTKDTEKDIDAVERAADHWNKTVGKGNKERIEVRSYHDVPPLDRDAQGCINKIIGRSHFAIALFWHRMGTPSRNHSSRKEEEFSICELNSIPVSIYVKEADLPRDLDLEQYRKMLDFLKERASNSLVGKYTSTDDLEGQLSRCLEDLLSNVCGRNQGSPRLQATIFSPTLERNEKNFLSILRNSLRPYGRYLSRQIGAPVFFLTIHPSRWEPIYCGLPDCSSEESAQQIRRKYERLLRNDFQAYDNLAPWEILDRVAHSFLDEIYNKKEEIMSGAISILLSDNGLLMGYESDSDRADQPPTAFLREDGEEGEDEKDRTPGWFQDALDFAGTFRFSVSGLSARLRGRGEEHFCKFLCDPSDSSRACGLEVRNYMRRPGLLPDRALILLAEYLLFKAQCISVVNEYPSIDTKPSNMNHFFLPLRSNGQWRTIACWLSFDESKGSGCGISSDTHEAMNHLWSQVYWEGFSATLRAELSASREDEKGASALYQALGMLWWGLEFWFYRNGVVIYHAASKYNMNERAVSGYNHLPVRPSPPRTNKFFSVKPERRRRGYATIFIDLRAIPGDRDPKVAKALAVEVVEIYVRLFDPDDPEKVEISEQLAARILLAV